MRRPELCRRTAALPWSLRDQLALDAALCRDVRYLLRQPPALERGLDGELRGPLRLLDSHSGFGRPLTHFGNRRLTSGGEHRYCDGPRSEPHLVQPPPRRSSRLARGWPRRGSWTPADRSVEEFRDEHRRVLPLAQGARG